MIGNGVKRHDILHITICAVVTGFLLFLSGIGNAATDAEDDTAIIAAVVTIAEGEVQLLRPGVAEALEVSEETNILVGDELITAADSEIELKLEDGSVLRVGPSSHIAIIEVNVVEVTGTTDTVIELVSGKLRSLVAPLVTGESSYTIRSENVTVGVRGTDFGVSYNPDKYTLEAICLDGMLEVSSQEWLDRGFDPIIILPGKGVKVQEGDYPGRSKSRSNRSIRGFFENMGFQGPTEGMEDALGGFLGSSMGVNPDAVGVEGLEEGINKALDNAPSGLGGGLDGLGGGGGFGGGGGGRGGF